MTIMKKQIKKLFYLLSTLFLLFLLSNCLKEKTSTQEASKILMVVPDKGFNEHEFNIPAKLLKENGYQIVVANVKGKSSQSIQGSEVKSDLALKKINPEDYLGVIYVGGYGAKIFFDNTEAISLAKQFYENGKPMGALCYSPVVFAKAGILEGKKAASWPDVSKLLTGAIFTNSAYEISGNIITGMGCLAEGDFSNDVMDFSREFLNLLNEKNNKSSSGQYNPKIDLLKEWKTKTAESQDINPAKLETALNNVKKYPGLRSLLIIRNGYLVSENYYADADANTLHPIHSASKSLTGILIGIAIRQGYIKSVDDPISKYLKKHLDSWTDEKEQIKIKHLLSMSSGLDWKDEYYGEFFESSEPVKAALSKQMAALPGEKFNYDVSSFLLSAIIQDTTGMSAYDFAKKNLFKPYEYGEVRWGSHGGYTMGFGDLYMRSRDMAKIGLLMIQKGVYKNKQLVSKSWVTDAEKPQIKTGNGLPPVENVGAITKVNYGYMNWLGWDGELAFYWAGGLGGQRIICVPEKKLIVVMTAYIPPLSEMDAKDWQKAGEQDITLLSFFVNDILPAVN